MILSPTFRGPKFEIFLAAKASPALLTFTSQNGDLKSILKFWEATYRPFLMNINSADEIKRSQKKQM
jgi:hypothetical protein